MAVMEFINPKLVTIANAVVFIIVGLGMATVWSPRWIVNPPARA